MTYQTHTAPDSETAPLAETVGRFAYINNLGYLYVVAALEDSLYGVLFTGGTADGARWYTAPRSEFGGWSYSLGDLSEFARALPEFFRTSPTGTGEETPTVDVSAAVEEARREERTRLLTEFEEWKERTTRIAHQYADDNDLCSEFDRCMEEIGLPARERDVELRVRVTLSVPVTVTASSEEEARNAISSESEALEYIGGVLGTSLPSSVSWYVSDWDVEEDY